MKIKLINRTTEGELVLEGHLDSVTSVDAGKIFTETAERFNDVILNMEGVEYVSSAGLRIIKLLYMAMTKKNGTLTLTNVRKSVMEVFEITGFAGLLTIK